MIRRLGNTAIVELANQRGYAVFEITGSSKVAQGGVYPLNSRKVWDKEPLHIGNYKIVARGDTNNLPAEIRDMCDDNNLVEGIFARQSGLQWGQGADLYIIEKKDGLRTKKWVEDKEIEAWLKTWDYENYLLRCLVDYTHDKGDFTKFYKNKGPRIGSTPRIAKLEHVSVNKCRLEWPEDGINYKNIIVGDWETQDMNSFISYPVFNPADPFAYNVSIMYANLYSFARDFNNLPSHYGTRNWIKLSSSIAVLLMNYNINSAAIKYHITSPQSYWDAKEDKLKENCVLKGIQYNDKMLEELKDATFKKFTETLTGIENPGKMLTTESYWNPDATNFEGWKVEVLDQKVKDYVDAQIAIAKQAESSTTSGLGLHPSLSNIMVDGKLASGSEQLYALKLYLATEIDIPQSIIFKAINTAIEVNFPSKNIKMGFYHDVVKTEDAVSPEKRVKNAV